MPPPFPALRRWIELPVLAAFAIIAGGAYVFVEMLEAVGAATPHAYDTAILLAFRTPGDPAVPLGPAWLPQAVRDMTSLGSASVLSFVTLASAGYLLLTRRAAMALYVLVAVAGGQALSSVLKLGVERPRPEIVPHLTEVFTLSFPSGHAMLSAATYLTLGILTAATAPALRVKVYLMAVACLATLIVGVSRLYLGVHWPSDVFAGWAAGAAWAVACWLAGQGMLRLHPNRGKDDAP